MAELADAYGSGPYERKFMGVQVPSPAPFTFKKAPSRGFFVTYLLSDSKSDQPSWSSPKRSQSSSVFLWLKYIFLVLRSSTKEMTKKRLGREGSTRYASNLLSIVTLLMGIVTVVSFVLATPIIWTQSFSAHADFDSGLSIYLVRFFVIEVVLYALSSIISGILNAERDYLWSNAAPIFNNIVCTSSFFLYVAFAKSNPTLAILSLALGNPLGVLVQLLVQLPSLRRHGIFLTPFIDWHDPALRETLSIGIPTLMVTIASFPTVTCRADEV